MDSSSLLDDQERILETQWLRRFLQEKQQEEEEKESRLSSSFTVPISDDDETICGDKTFLPTSIAQPDLDAQILDWAVRFLAIKQCPQELAAVIARRIVQDIRRDEQMLMACRNLEKSDHTTVFDSSKLEKVMMEVVYDVCLDWNDNFPLDLLPAVSSDAQKRVVSSSAIKNGRRTMEDQHVIVPDLNLLLGLKDQPAQSFYAVFDGHAGFEAANYASAHLHHNVVKADSYPSDVEKAIKEGFLKTDEMFLRKAEREDLKSGTTALCCLIRDKTLYVGWLGDSQACLVRRGSPVELVTPHKPSRQDERDRIDALGGCVVYFGTWRVNGSLAVSRAIGDVSYKPHVSADADVTVTELDGTEDFLILGCDGLWDVKTPTEAALHVYSYLEQNPGNAEDVASKLVLLAKNAGSCDNITVIVVFLRNIGELHGPSATLGVDSTKTVILESPADDSRHFPYGYPAESQEAQNLFLMGEVRGAVPDILPQETVPKWSSGHDDEIQVSPKETSECLLGFESLQSAVQVDGGHRDETVQSVEITSSQATDAPVFSTAPGTNPFAAEFTPRETLISSSSSSSTTNVKYDYFSQDNLAFGTTTTTATTTTNVTDNDTTEFSPLQSPDQDVPDDHHHHHPEVAGFYSGGGGVSSSNDVIFEREALESQDADSGIDASPQDNVPNAEVCGEEDLEEHQVFIDPIKFDGAAQGFQDGQRFTADETETEMRSVKLSEEESEKVRAGDPEDDALIQDHQHGPYPSTTTTNTNDGDLFGGHFISSSSAVSGSGLVPVELYDGGVDLYGAEYDQVTSPVSEGLGLHPVGHELKQTEAGALLQETYELADTELGSEVAEVESELERRFKNVEPEFEIKADVVEDVLQQDQKQPEDHDDLFCKEDAEVEALEREDGNADLFRADATEVEDVMNYHQDDAALFGRDDAEVEALIHNEYRDSDLLNKDSAEVESIITKQLEDELVIQEIKPAELEINVAHAVAEEEHHPEEPGTVAEESQRTRAETEPGFHQTEEVESKSSGDVNVEVTAEVDVEYPAEEQVAEVPIVVDVLHKTPDTKTETEPEREVSVPQVEETEDQIVEMPDLVLSNGISHEDEDVPRKETIAVEVLDDDESEDGDEWKFYRGDRSAQDESQQQLSVQLDFSESEVSKVDQPSHLEDLSVSGGTSQEAPREVAPPVEPVPEQVQKKQEATKPAAAATHKVPTGGAPKSGKPALKDGPKGAAPAAKRPLKTTGPSATQKAPAATTRPAPSTSRAPLPTNRVPTTTKPASVPAAATKKPIEKPIVAKRPTTLATASSAAAATKVGETKRVPLSRPASSTTTAAAARAKPEAASSSAAARPHAAASSTAPPKRPATVPPKTLAPKPRALEAKLTKDAVNQQISTNVKKTTSASATARTVNGGVAQRTTVTKTAVVTKATTSSSSTSATAKLNNGVKKEAVPKTSPSPSKALKISPPISTSSPKRTPTTTSSAARTATTPARTPPTSATKTSSPVRKNLTPSSKIAPKSKGSTEKKPVPHSASNGNEKGALDAAAKEGCGGGSSEGQTPSPKEGLATNGIHQQDRNEASLI